MKLPPTMPCYDCDEQVRELETGGGVGKYYRVKLWPHPTLDGEYVIRDGRAIRFTKRMADDTERATGERPALYRLHRCARKVA